MLLPTLRSKRACKCCEDKDNESSSTTTKPKTSKTPQTYRPPRVRNPLQMDDESIEWVESGVTPDWIEKIKTELKNGIEEAEGK
jgi:hypothetical protein